jgi:hypothetical protein
MAAPTTITLTALILLLKQYEAAIKKCREVKESARDAVI